MKKITVFFALAVLIVATLSGCLPVDGEPDVQGAGMTGEAVEAYEPETIEGWGEGVNSFAAYSGSKSLLENLQDELDLAESGIDLSGSELWWINDEAVTELYGEDVFADGACYEGIFRFMFSSRQEDS